MDVPDVLCAVQPPHYQRDHPLLAFGLEVPADLSPAELGFRLPKPVEQNSKFAGHGDAGTL